MRLIYTYAHILSKGYESQNICRRGIYILYLTRHTVHKERLKIIPIVYYARFSDSPWTSICVNITSMNGFFE